MDTTNIPLTPTLGSGEFRLQTLTQISNDRLVFQFCLGQIQSLRQSRRIDGGVTGAQGGPANMPQITGLDVTCEKTGMLVSLQFSAPFNGVVFSKGHFSNPSCR